MADRFDLINFGKSVVTTTGGTTANVNIDANTLFIDGTNNRVGVGVDAPTARFEVSGSGFNGGQGIFRSTNSGVGVSIIGVNGAGINDSAFILLQDGTAARNSFIGLTGDAATGGAGGLRFATGNNTERMRVAANGNIGIGNTTPAHALSINGALRTTSLSTNYVQSDAVAITVGTTTPTEVCSVTITTLGKPVLLLAAGDRNPLVGGNWHYGQFYRDSTPIGKRYIGQMSFQSYNQPFAHCFVDAPSAGTYSYQFRVWQGSGSVQYGEEGNGQAPTIIAMELI